ncbi:hypothetical protein HNP46_006082 [Pseudomonas nitritireducens]|uniref:Uncharacterized protein n=1 Tax=Pseudomonas nitroreducens TaxID=46680 RepID=A0A7W7P3Y8_PSENT|nr:hypothetical protein [Pseudomonas nitritireducens]MBB4867171.1 hypothetical protein [Pseudomonas nitritireducens]
MKHADLLARLAGTHVVDDAGLPLRVYRGEKAAPAPGHEGMHTLLPSLSFASARIASAYSWADIGEDAWCRAEPSAADAPRVYPVYLDMKNPAFNQPNDPFLEYTDLVRVLGEDLAMHFMVQHEQLAMQTGAWEELSDELGCSSIAQVANKDRARLNELYIQLYPLLDDPDFIGVLRQAGYDGAIYTGSGVGLREVEYRVFDESSVIYAFSVEPAPAPAIIRERVVEETCFSI